MLCLRAPSRVTECALLAASAPPNVTYIPAAVGRLGLAWSLDLATSRWTERTGQTKPPAREHYGIAFDSMRGRLVLFGGSGSGVLNDTWEYDPRSGTWRQAVIEGASPSPRSRHESAYAADRGTAFFFGGIASSGTSNELWMLGPGFATARPQITRPGIVNAFSGQTGAIAPGAILSLYGSGLGPVDGVTLAFDPLTAKLPTSGPGVAVTFNGVPAPLYFVRSDQLNVQVPYEVQGSAEASITVTVNGSSNDPLSVPVAATMPGLFPRIFHPDGSVNSAANAAPAGSVVILYATGQGPTNPPSVTGAYPAGGVYPEPVANTVLRIGGVEAELLFRGQAPGTAGVMQINARIPAGITGPAVPVSLIIGGAASQSGVPIAVR